MGQKLGGSKMREYKQKNDKEQYSNNWSTPIEIYERFKELGYHDPCPLGSYIEPDEYDYDGKMFINPPYERGVLDKFIDMGIRLHSKYGKEIVYLVPARTDTRWFWKLMDYGCEVEFIRGRLKFGGVKESAPFPSIYIKVVGK